MGASGNIIADFGPWPGQSDVIVAVTGQAGIVANSEVEAWVEPNTTAAGFQSDGYPLDGVRKLTRGANLTGIADQNQGIVSAFFYDDNGGPANAFQILIGDDGAGNGEFAVVRNGNLYPPRYIVAADTSTGLAIFTLPPVGDAFQPVRRWTHLLAAWDVANNLGSIYLDDVLIGTMSRLRNNAVPYSAVTDWGVGVDATFASTIWRGAIADLYFNAGAYLDLSVAANRRKFTTVAGDGTLRPIDLGATGSGPTGAQPILYMHMDHGADPATFLTNKGSGGNFSLISGTVPIAGQALPLCLAPGHSADEHAIETIEAKADKSSIVAATGFNIRVRNTSQNNELLMPDGLGGPVRGGRGTRPCGKYNVGWAWN